MINPRFMTGLLCTAFLVGCGSVNTYRATVGEADGKAAYTSQINDVRSNRRWSLSGPGDRRQ